MDNDLVIFAFALQLFVGFISIITIMVNLEWASVFLFFNIFAFFYTIYIWIKSEKVK